MPCKGHDAESGIGTMGRTGNGNGNGAVSWKRRLLPFLAWTPLVNASTLQADFWAALTGALVVLPQGIAYATIAGMPPVYGLYAGMIPAVIAALFGSSWQLVSGPTVAGSLVMFSALSAMAEPASAQYVVLALTLAFLVGVIELRMGIFRLGALVNFISHSVIVGFTAGAGVLIAANQLRNFLRLDQMPRGLKFFEVLEYVSAHMGDASWMTALVGTITVVTALAVKRYCAALALHDRGDGRGEPGGLHIEPDRSGRGADGRRFAVEPAAAFGAELRSGDVAIALLGHFRNDAVCADRGHIHRPRACTAYRPAHRCQPGVHRAGAFQHRRCVLLGLCGHGLVQPQRAQLFGGRARRRLPRSWPACC